MRWRWVIQRARAFGLGASALFYVHPERRWATANITIRLGHRVFEITASYDR